jgi:hypothetical protein
MHVETTTVTKTQTPPTQLPPSKKIPSFTVLIALLAVITAIVVRKRG